MEVRCHPVQGLRRSVRVASTIDIGIVGEARRNNYLCCKSHGRRCLKVVLAEIRGSREIKESRRLKYNSITCKLELKFLGECAKNLMATARVPWLVFFSCRKAHRELLLQS